jgi:hypothetical protein
MNNNLKKTDIEAFKEMSRILILAFPIVFMVILPWLFGRTPHWGVSYWWPLLLSIGLLGLYLIYPLGLYYPCRLWLAISSILGWFNTRVILGIAYYGLIMPIGWLLRRLGKLQYDTGLKRSKQNSFWIKRQDINDKQRMKDPF